MGVYDLLKDIKEGHSYEVITTWRGLPIRIKLKVKWISLKDRLVSFDFFGCKFRRAFTEEKVHIKLGEYYIECDIFSSIRDELVLKANAVCPPPPCIIRELVRVEPAENKPVLVSFCIEDECIGPAKAIDISEKGVGVILSKQDIEKLCSALDIRIEEKYSINVSLIIEIPGEGSIKAVGELRNIVCKEEECYFRLGFKLDLMPPDLRKLRNYIINRQKEILDELRAL